MTAIITCDFNLWPILSEIVWIFRVARTFHKKSFIDGTTIPCQFLPDCAKPHEMIACCGFRDFELRPIQISVNDKVFQNEKEISKMERLFRNGNIIFF